VKKINFLSIFGLFFLAAVWSEASYTITPLEVASDTSPVVQGRYYRYSIKNNGTPPSSLNDFKLTVPGLTRDVGYGIFAQGFETGPNSFSVDGTAERILSIRFYGTGSFSIHVENTGDSADFGDTHIFSVQHYPTSFALQTPLPTFGANQPASVTVQAFYGANIIDAFDDPVEIYLLNPALGNPRVGTIDLGQFSNGEASTDIAIQAGNLSNQFQLRIQQTGTPYTLPSGDLPLPFSISPVYNLVPGPFSKVVMLFPGQTLSPGQGKIGAATSVNMMQEISLVEIRCVDQYYNPILTPPPAPISLNFTSSANLIDTTFPATRIMNSAIRTIVAGDGLMIFQSAGTRVVTVIPDGDGSKLDTVSIDINSGPATQYTIETVPANLGTVTTDDTLHVVIKAYNPQGDLMTGMNECLPGAELRAHIADGSENRLWIDTDPSDLVPQNNICFTAGKSELDLTVTKQSSDVFIKFYPPGAPTTNLQTSSFRVNAGSRDHVEFVINGTAANPNTGESLTEGTYPGKTGMPPTNISVGTDLIVEAFIVDRRWNLVSNADNTNVLVRFKDVTPANPAQPHIYTDWFWPKDPSATVVLFPFTNGKLAYSSDPNWDYSFRVKFRTAGPNQLIPAPPYITGEITNRSFLSGSEFNSSTMTILAGAFNRVVLVVPGETPRPGIKNSSTGKTGSPDYSAAAGIQSFPAGATFHVSAYATDSYFNPVSAGNRSVNFDFNPVRPYSFVVGGNPKTVSNGSLNTSIACQETSTVTLRDINSGASQDVAIPVSAGALQHFTMILNSVPPFLAGSPFNVTIEARDRFENVVAGAIPVTLLPNTGVGTMSPTSITLGADGRYTGDLRVFTATTTAQIKVVYQSYPTDAPVFEVDQGSYAKLLLLGPDETYMPGTALGKSGSNLDRAVGNGITLRVYATDAYFNLVNTSGQTIMFTDSNSDRVFAPETGMLGAGKFTTTFIMKEATTHIVRVDDMTTGGIAGSTSAIRGYAGDPALIQLVLPGEVLNPGDEVHGGKDPNFSASAQIVSVPFSVSIRAVDQFYNLITNFNGGDSFLAANTPNAQFIPPNNIPNGPTPRRFVNGISTRTVIIGQDGLFLINAKDQLNLAMSGQNVEVRVNPGPEYAFITPNSVIAGAPPVGGFAATIRLMKDGSPVSSGGVPQNIYLTAVNPNDTGIPASGSLTTNGSPYHALMTDGVVTIPNLQYSYVETIKIQITDDFNRVAFSSAIVVNPSGLKYQIVLPADAVVGPPNTFPVRIELHDLNTDTLVRNSAYNHTINISVMPLLPMAGLPAATFSAPSISLVNGVATFDAWYSRAEQIKLHVVEQGGALGVIPSDSDQAMTVNPDSYIKLLILAPGETQVPGVYQHLTGKTGTPSELDKTVGHDFVVLAVDKNWNTVKTYSGGQIFFESLLSDGTNEGSTNLSNPVQQNSPLSNGKLGANIKLFTTGAITLKVQDKINSIIVPASVVVPVKGSYFVISAPQQTNTCASFTMNIQLVDTSSQTIDVSGPISIEALKMDGSPAQGALDKNSDALSHGLVTISQGYTIAEDIRIRVTGHDTITLSNKIHFVPRAVYYVFQGVPQEVGVHETFNFKIQAMDADCTTPIQNMTRLDLPLNAVAVDPTVPLGIFSPATVKIENGVANVSAQYNKAMSIFLQLNDPTDENFGTPPVPSGHNFLSTPIRVKPGALAKIGLTDFSLQSNQTTTYILVAQDSYNNLIPGQLIQMDVTSIDPPGRMLLNGEANHLLQRTDANGRLPIQFQPSVDTNGQVSILIKDGDHPDGFSQNLTVTVLGYPYTPARALDWGENKIPVHSTVILKDEDYVGASDLKAVNGITPVVRVYYKLDNGPKTVYNPAAGITGFDQTKTYELEWWSEICYDGGACSDPIIVPSQFRTLDAITVASKLAGFPSPFNPKKDGAITLQYPLTVISSVEIDIYDLFGQKVYHLDIPAGAEGGQAKPNNMVPWPGKNQDGNTVGNGGYIVRVKVGATGQTMKTKILVVK